MVPRPAYLPFLVASTEDKQYFDWFMCRAIIKLPGSFVSGFWTTLLLQASLSEPAVLHAVLALSSVHRGGVLNDDRQEQSNSVPDKLEQFTLQHYVKAIGHLQPRFLAKDRASCRIALIACIVFISLDFLRGHFTTAQIHLQNGLKLLREKQLFSDRKNDGILLPRPCGESVDDWIVEVLSRMHVNVELFKQPHQHPCPLLQAAEPGPPVAMFCSFRDAWHELDRLLNEIFQLTKQSCELKADCTTLHRPSALLEDQQRIQMELAQWLHAFKASKEVIHGRGSMEREKGYRLLGVYHTMLTIMGDTCLCPSDELVFDSHTDQFAYLIELLADLWAFGSNVSTFENSSRDVFNMSRSIVDMGCIQPLYYVAVKCRVHRIRLHAIRLLETTFHREGIWDAKISARVSRKVLEIEEGDYYRDIEISDDFHLFSPPRPQDLSLPPLPESHRIRDLEVVLSGEPMNKVLLLCKQRQDGLDCKARIEEYDVPSQRWMDTVWVTI